MRTFPIPSFSHALIDFRNSLKIGFVHENCAALFNLNKMHTGFLAKNNG